MRESRMKKEDDKKDSKAINLRDLVRVRDLKPKKDAKGGSGIGGALVGPPPPRAS